MSRIGRYLLSEVAVLARVGGRYEPYWPLFAVWRGCSGPYRWPSIRLIAATDTGQNSHFIQHEVAAPARVGGRYEPCWPLFCRMVWLPWPVSLGAMSRAGRYLLREAAALARIGGRSEPYWPLFAV